MPLNPRFAAALLGTAAAFTLPNTAVADTNSGYLIHDMDREQAPVVTPGKEFEAPSDAIVLFDGTDLSAWRTEDGGTPKWKVENGYFEAVSGSDDIFTKEGFGDCQLHIEWASPADPAGKDGQNRGNSGVFFMEKYEIQVLDSHNNRTYADGHAGSVYAQYPPQVNATRPPGEWQRYDIIFHRPRFNEDGTVKQPARMTALLNGILVQDGVELTGPTSWLMQKPYEKHPDKMSIKLQDHDSPVRFRNIWIRPLSQPEHLKPIPMKKREHKVALSPAQLDRFVGSYDHNQGDKPVPFIVVRREGNQLFATVRDKREWALFAQSETEFVFDNFDGTLTFKSDANGAVTGVDFLVGLKPKFENKL